MIILLTTMLGIVGLNKRPTKNLNESTFNFSKSKDFLLFDEVCQMILLGQHLNSEGLKDIIKNRTV